MKAPSITAVPVLTSFLLLLLAEQLYCSIIWHSALGITCKATYVNVLSSYASLLWFGDHHRNNNITSAWVSGETEEILVHDQDIASIKNTAFLTGK